MRWTTALSSAAAVALLSTGAVLAQGQGNAERAGSAAAAQPGETPTASPAAGTQPAPAGLDLETTVVRPDALNNVPVVNLYIGGTTKADRPTIDVPNLDDKESIARGARYYNAFNCVGCHAPNGAGGMGRSLSNAYWQYGGEPENIYLSILHGRPVGMPAYGMIVPDNIIWDLVAYVKSISKNETDGWGQTISVGTFKTEQVPAEYLNTNTPWEYTQPFSFGQPPYEKVQGSPPLPDAVAGPEGAAAGASQ